MPLLLLRFLEIGEHRVAHTGFIFAFADVAGVEVIPDVLFAAELVVGRIDASRWADNVDEARGDERLSLGARGEVARIVVAHRTHGFWRVLGNYDRN